MKTMYYNSLQTGKIMLYVVKYSDIESKEVRYILYDIGLGFNIYEDINTGKIYAIPDDELFWGGCIMYCTFNGKTCLMMWDIIAEKYVYIPESIWYSFTEKAKERYTEERI